MITGTVPPELTAVRHTIATIFLFGTIGTFAELLLLGHIDGAWQIAPLVLLAIGGAGWAMLQVSRGARVLRVFQAVMALFIASGVLGVLLHYRGNVEFELELHPGASGWELFARAMTGATPALAPGLMILLGALGLASTYGHPATSAARRRDLDVEGELT